MSNKSGTAEQVITLPKGGGELKGMGETFSPDLHTGTGNFSVPIALPSGRNGFQPEIGLVYSTGNGNTCFGLGWQLSVPGVSRKTSKGIPRYQGKDTFLLSGAEDLIPTDQGDNYIRYRPRTEGLFAIIQRIRDANDDYWEVKTKDGLISHYGSPNSIGNDPATVFDPKNPNHLFCWKLSETIDVFGNRIIYEYERDLADTQNRHFNQTYLKTIKYLDYLDEQGNEQFLVKVDFEYENERLDPFSVFTSGFEIRTRKICKRIVVKTYPDQQETLVRSYEFSYQNAERSLVSLLKEVQVVGHDGDKEERLPPLTFSYTPFVPKGRDFSPLKGRDLPANSLSNPDTEMVDLFGNGLPDIVQMNGTVRYWKNLGNGTYDIPRTMKEAPAGVNIANPNVQFMDANGEGRADLVVTDGSLSGYFPTNFKGGWDQKSFRKHKLAPTFSFADPEAKLVDLNGDGVADLLRSGSRMECYFNDPKEGWNEVLQVERKAVDEFPNITFTDPRIQLADMTGDSLQDIVSIADGNVEYWPYMGYGKWGKRIHMRNSPRFPYGYDPKHILLGDIAGDGPHDVIYVDHGKLHIWINQNGNGFSERIVIDGTPPVTDMDSVRLVDLYGTGTSGILWSSDKRVNGRDHMFFLDLTEGIKPFVLNEMNNHMGAITKVEYRPSTYYYLQDEKDRATRWQTPLPFPVQVVACVEVIDEISKNKLTTEYSYHHGYWDGAEREFRGFGRVEQRDTQSFDNYRTSGLHEEAPFQEVEEKYYTPPTLTKTWFHQGPVGEEFGDWTICDFTNEFWQGDPQKFNQDTGIHDLIKHLPRRAQRDAHRSLRGSVLRTELYALDKTERENKPYTVTESFYYTRQEFSPDDSPFEETPKGTSGYIFFPLVAIQRTTQWERGDDPMTQFSFSEAYDAFGIPTVQVAIACPRGWRNMGDRFAETTPFLSTYSISQLAYSNTEFPYIKGRSVKASSYEILHQGDQSVWDIKANIQNLDLLKLIAQSITYYDGEAFEGLPFGEIGNYGVPVRTESLVIDEAILQEAWKNENGDVNIPTYLNANNPENWPSEYPTSFQNSMTPLAGYTFYDGTDEHARGYWAHGSSKFDFQDATNPYAKGLPLEQQDALGRKSSIEYDKYQFLPVKATDPLGLKMQAENDYRLFQPWLSTDANDNKSMVRFSPLGFVMDTFLIGKEGEEEGDALDRNDFTTSGTRNEYDFFAFINDGNPIYVKSIVREHHKYETDVPVGQFDDTITTVEYSDGFGRLVQTRTQAEDVLFGDPLLGNELLPEDQQSPETTTPKQGIIRQPNEPINVVVSGWQIYDNKGQVVQQYEPFYSKGFEYINLLENDLLVGQKVEQFYDPLGRVIRTLNPDGSEQNVIFGIPVDLDYPKVFTSTPWEAYTYDANDNAFRTGHTDRVDESHWNTPSSMELDALGRTIKAIARNRDRLSGDTWSEIYEMVTESNYDIRGNLLTVTDPLGRLAFQYTYDLTFDEENGSMVWRIQSIDAGLRRICFNVLGLEIERRDSKGCVSLQAYDEGNRLTLFWASDKADLPVTLRQKLIYGDKLDQENEKDVNLLGQLYQHYDEAGLVEVPSYDFKGNAPIGKRQVIKDQLLVNLSGSNTFQHFQVDWENNTPADLIDPKVFQTDTTYDALNRPKTITYPEDVDNERKVFLPRYNRAGALEGVSLGGYEYVKHIAYNAKGQRTLIAYGNGLMTRYAYDDVRFWLTRLRTEKYNIQGSENFNFIPSGGMLQDLGYEYDLVGNILKIKDRSQGSGVGGSDELDKDFSYDPIYRLLSATGREHTSRDPKHNEPWAQAMTHTNQDVNTTRFYTRQYQYDKAGNMLHLQHINPNSIGNFSRTFKNKEENNQLEYYQQGGDGFRKTLTYDLNGNMTNEGISRYYQWNHADQLHTFRVQANDISEPSLEARYLYDAGGQRVKKIVWHQGGKVTTTTYIGNAFELHSEGTKANIKKKENSTLHVMDDESRIALIQIGNSFRTQPLPTIQYQLGDHLGNVHVVADENGSSHSQEEHYPYGGTSFGSFSTKRYRFTGKERDEESGLSYHGARYYLPWIKKWCNTDPIGIVGGINLFQYANNNPLVYKDMSGTQPKTTLSDEERFVLMKNFELTEANQKAATAKNFAKDEDPKAPIVLYHITEHPDIWFSERKFSIKAREEFWKVLLDSPGVNFHQGLPIKVSDPQVLMTKAISAAGHIQAMGHITKKEYKEFRDNANQHFRNDMKKYAKYWKNVKEKATVGLFVGLTIGVAASGIATASGYSTASEIAGTETVAGVTTAGGMGVGTTTRWMTAAETGTATEIGTILAPAPLSRAGATLPETSDKLLKLTDKFFDILFK